jgi:AcrR family transcriptional regulator
MPRTADPLAKSKLLRAARQEFAAVGLSQARVEDIAKRAKLAKGSFYLHFKTKEGAFHELVDHFLAELQRVTEEYHPECVTQVNAEEALDVFRVHDERMLEFLWDNRDIMRMILYGGKVRHQFAHALDAFLDAQAAQIANGVKALQANGVYANDFDADACAWLLAGAWFNLSRRMCQMPAHPDFKRWAWTLRRLFGQGLVAR